MKLFRIKPFFPIGILEPMRPAPNPYEYSLNKQHGAIDILSIHNPECKIEYNDGRIEDIYDVSQIVKVVINPPNFQSPINCRNCGANEFKENKCNYCNTER